MRYRSGPSTSHRAVEKAEARPPIQLESALQSAATRTQISLSVVVYQHAAKALQFTGTLCVQLMMANASLAHSRCVSKHVRVPL